jgi:predicted DsbA family dithiol-disulfide isomerase
MTTTVEVVEFTDPGCAWSWGSEPVLRWLRHRYADHLSWRRVLGVQLDGPAGADADEPAEQLRGRWLAVAAYTAAPVAQQLERAHASTRPAALAAKAAERQGPAVAEAVLRRLREAFFVAGRPPDARARIADALQGVPDLDSGALLEDLESEAVSTAIDRDWLETREPHRDVVGLEEPGPHCGAAKQDGKQVRYGFPTLLVRGPGGELVVPGWRPPGSYRAAIESVAPELTGVRERALNPVEALDRYRSLSPWDLVLLTGRRDAPAQAIRLETATAPLWLHHEEAAHLAHASLAEASL